LDVLILNTHIRMFIYPARVVVSVE